MSHSRLAVIAISLALLLALSAAAFAQTTSAGTGTSSPVPSLINYSGVLKDGTGKTVTSITGVTFLIYTDEQGGSPLWLETQNVTPDRLGRYTVQLGSTSASGLPQDLFQNGQARWLGVQAQGQQEQPRVMLLSVPYALKAADAQTIGGLPASAFVLAAPSQSGSAPGEESSNVSSSPFVSGSGTADFIPIWTSSQILANSVLFQSGSGNSALVGINTTTPASTLDVNGGVTSRGALQLPSTGTANASQGFNSQPFSLQGSSFNSGTSQAIGPLFQWQTEPSGNNTSNPAGTLNLLYGTGSGSPTETGLNIASNGQITFAKNQTFPGTGNGTITGVTAGTGLSGGGTSGTVTLTNTGILSLTPGSGIVSSGGQTPTISNSGVLNLTAGTGLNVTGGQSPIVSINTSVVPELGTANTFTQNLATTGELSAGGTPVNHIANGTVEVDAGNTNNGSFSPALTFGGGGEVIASNRAGTVNLNGIDFYTKTARRMSVTNGGQVGINTATPSHLFEVDASTTVAQMAMVSSGTDAAISVKNTATGGREYWIDSGSGAAGIGAGNFAVYDVTAGSTRFVINSSGNVGIGTTTPAYNLDVQGTGNFTGNLSATGVVSGSSYQTGNNLFAFGSYANESAFLGFAGIRANQNVVNDTAVGYAALGGDQGGSNTAVGQLALVENTTGSQNTGAGTAALWDNTTGSNNTAAGYSAGQTDDFSPITGENDSFLGFLTALSTGTLNNATAVGAFAEVAESNTLVLGCISGVNGCPASVNVGIGTTTPDQLLSVNGNADKPGGGSWGTFSDRRLKILDGDFSSGLSQILKINPVRYRYKADNAMGIRDQEEHVGLVAQEVQKVIPEAVTENGKGYLLVNNDPVIWTMLNAIKEQQRLIGKQQQQLRTQQQQLRTQQAQLKAQVSKARSQDAQITELMSRVKAIQASLKTNGRTGPEIRTVKAQAPLVRY